MVPLGVMNGLVDFLANGLTLASFLLGALSVLLADLGLNWNERRMRRQRIRREFIVELESMDRPLRALRNEAQRTGTCDVEPYRTRLRPDVFRSNMDDLKYLRTRELEVLYSYYTGLEDLLDAIDVGDGTLDGPSFASDGVAVDDVHKLVYAHRAALMELARYPETWYGQIPEDRGPIDVSD